MIEYSREEFRDSNGLSIWLESDLKQREQQRERRTLGFVAVVGHGALVRTNERPWLGRSIMDSRAAVANPDVRRNITDPSRFCRWKPLPFQNTRTELMLLLLLAATGCC